MDKKKLVFISNMASPYQVKFCYALQEYFDAEFWFYVMREDDRPEWWEIPLGEKCKVMKYSGLISTDYFSFGLFQQLAKFKPDIILLGGFMKWHWLVLRYAKLTGAKVGFMSENLRDGVSDSDASDQIMTRETSNRKIKAISTIFKGADLYLGMGETAARQFKEHFYFPLDKIDSMEYPTDIDEYYEHHLREKSTDDEFIILFANRLIDRYQPLYALEIFKELSKRNSNVSMKMNRDGELKKECEDYIRDNNLTNVSFLKEIECWADLGNIYKNSDIVILPASYSNGNLSIFECGASGMGIVMSNKVNNMDREFINEENCFVCNLDRDEFVYAIEQYIKNPELLIAHGKRSRELLEPHRNHNNAKKYYELLLKHGLV